MTVSIEELVLKEIDEASVVDLLVRLVRIRSVLPPEDETAMKEIAAFVERELDACGITTQRVGDEGKGWARPNVLGFMDGSGGGPTLLLAAHTDVVPGYDLAKWTYPPFDGIVADGFVHGRGTADTKGSLAGMIAGFTAVKKAGVKLRGNCRLVAWAGDEWQPPDAKYFNGLSFLAFNDLMKGDAIILGEPYDLNITYTSRGRIWIRFLVGGVASHSATGHGVSAIRKSMKLIDEIYKINVGTHPVMGRDTINVGVIKGGDQPNMVPDWCTFTFDIRFAPPLTVEKVWLMVKEKADALAASDPEFDLKEMQIVEKREPLEFPAGSELNRAIKRAGEAAGRNLVLGGAVSFGDTADWKDRAGIKAACLLGPGKTKEAHAVNEKVSVEDLVAAARVYALTIVNMCG